MWHMNQTSGKDVVVDREICAGFLMRLFAAEHQRDELLEALKDIELRCTQARLASGIGRKKDQTDFLLSELERISKVAAIANVNK
jgi:hypothetical protein